MWKLNETGLLIGVLERVELVDVTETNGTSSGYWGEHILCECWKIRDVRQSLTFWMLWQMAVCVAMLHGE